LNIENDEIEYNTDIEKVDLISDLDEPKKEREENKSLKIELMKQKESGQSFKESQEARNIEENLEGQNKCVEAIFAA
jgi:hypothetical protein